MTDNQPVPLPRRSFIGSMVAALAACVGWRRETATPPASRKRVTKPRKVLYRVVLVDRDGREFETKIRHMEHIGRSLIVQVAAPIKNYAVGAMPAYQPPIDAEFRYVGQRPDGDIIARHVSGPEYWKARA